jgi:hypothetical protein
MIQLAMQIITRNNKIFLSQGLQCYGNFSKDLFRLRFHFNTYLFMEQFPLSSSITSVLELTDHKHKLTGNKT